MQNIGTPITSKYLLAATRKIPQRCSMVSERSKYSNRLEPARHLSFLERCHWETRLWVDDKEIGMQNTLGTPHQYDLSDVLTPGKHTLTLRIDNRIKDIDPGENSHSISDHTQGNWNGVIGDMYLQVRPQVSIVHTDIYPDINAKNIRVKTYMKNKKKTKATAILTLKANGKSIQQEIVLLPGENKTETILSLGDNICLWDEFNPNLYILEASLTDKEKQLPILIQSSSVCAISE